MNESKFKKRQQELVANFHQAPIRKAFGMSLRYDEENSAIFELPYNPNLDHALGGIHGGVIATLLDNAGWFTVAIHCDNWISTVEFHVRLLEPIEKKDIYSRGRLLRLGKRLAVAEMEVRTAENLLVATGSGTYSITSIPFRVLP